MFSFVNFLIYRRLNVFNKLFLLANTPNPKKSKYTLNFINTSTLIPRRRRESKKMGNFR